LIGLIWIKVDRRFLATIERRRNLQRNRSVASATPVHSGTTEAAIEAHPLIIARESKHGPAGPARPGPTVAAASFAHPGNGSPLPLLAAETACLAAIASIICLAKGARIYEEGDQAHSIYIVIKGEVKTFRALSSGRCRVTAFLSAGDVAGLGENGLYVSTAQALTPLITYRLPLNALDQMLRSDPALEHCFLCKLWHDLRAARAHAIMLGRHDAQGKLAMFLRERDAHKPVASPLASRIVLPMTRSDVADYLPRLACSRARGVGDDAHPLARRPRLASIPDTHHQTPPHRGQPVGCSTSSPEGLGGLAPGEEGDGQIRSRTSLWLWRQTRSPSPGIWTSSGVSRGSMPVGGSAVCADRAKLRVWKDRQCTREQSSASCGWTRPQNVRGHGNQTPDAPTGDDGKGSAGCIQ